ncbi:hypothetical protein ABHI18_012549, partial [Aspergillus niger]
EAWSWSEQDWETPALYPQALRSPGKANRAALASKYGSRHALEMNFNGRSSAGWASGHFCVCSLLPIAQGHMLTPKEEQIPKPPSQMTMQASVQDAIWGKRIGVGMGKGKCVRLRRPRHWSIGVSSTQRTWKAVPDLTSGLSGGHLETVGQPWSDRAQ